MQGSKKSIFGHLKKKSVPIGLDQTPQSSLPPIKGAITPKEDPLD